MHRPTVFLITGYARAGKDTAAQAIVDTLKTAEVIHYADLLKDAVNELFVRCGIERVNVHETADKVRFRELLVAAGRAARSVDQHVFADNAALAAHLALMRGRCAVIPDWRYCNELTRLIAKVGDHRVVTMHIRRDGQAAANQEEADSVDAILDTFNIDHSATFPEGATGSIRDWASSIAIQRAVPVRGA